MPRFRISLLTSEDVCVLRGAVVFLSLAINVLYLFSYEANYLYLLKNKLKRIRSFSSPFDAAG